MPILLQIEAGSTLGSEYEEAEDDTGEVDDHDPVQPDAEPSRARDEGEPGRGVHVLQPVKLRP